MTLEVSSKYFKPVEALETLTGKFYSDAPLKLKVYTYKTGAVYTGQWRGGLRHGNGTMVWPDNARYEG
jgi:MORN repeat